MKPAPRLSPEPAVPSSAGAGLTRRAFLGAAALLGLAPGTAFFGLAPGTALAQGGGSSAVPLLSRSQSLFRIATGTTGGTYYPIGAIIANALSNPPGTRPCDRGGSCGVPGLIAVAQATGGSVENVDQLRNGAAEAAMMQADVAWQAYAGIGRFAGQPAFAAMRSLGALYTETLHVVATAAAGVKSLADLRHLRVSLGEEGSGTLVDARLALAAFGVRETDLRPVYLKPAGAADRMAAGELDAFFMMGGYPIQAIQDVASRTPVTLVPLDGAGRERLLRDHRFFSEAAIPAGVYPNVTATPTVGVAAELIVRADRDPELIYQVLRSLWHDRTRVLLREGHPRGDSINVINAVIGVSAPLHAGAERFYRELGLLGDPPTP